MGHGFHSKLLFYWRLPVLLCLMGTPTQMQNYWLWWVTCPNNDHGLPTKKTTSPDHSRILSGGVLRIKCYVTFFSN
jgi:hypothetical protein